MAVSAALEIELPDEQTVRQAEDAVHRLNGLLSENSSGSAPVRLIGGNGKQDLVAVDLPEKADGIIVDVLAELAKGNAVTVVPVRAELTTQQAANILNVSCPYLIELLKEGKIPYRMVGNLHMIPLLDLLDYKRRVYASRRKIALKLTEEAQRIGLEY